MKRTINLKLVIKKTFMYIKGNWIDALVLSLVIYSTIADMLFLGLSAVIVGIFSHVSDIRNDTRYMRNLQALAYLKYVTDKKEASDEKNQDNQG